MNSKREDKLELRIKTESWVMTNSDLLNKAGFDRRAKIPEGTLQKFIKHNQKINDKRIKSIYRIIKKLQLE